MEKLGSIEKVEDLRSVWKHEAKDFSTWLSNEENLLTLSESIGINNIILEERESSVGSFNVDLYATEESSGRKIIIENQLEETNHDHLGKIITYASGKDAKIIIWIVKKAREEHQQAIEWLNQHTDNDIGFFLIEIELWKIDNSNPAPMFHVVERPNDWAKTMKNIAGLSNTKRLQLNFWQNFNDYADNNRDFTKIFSLRKPQAQHWYDLSVGTSAYHICLTVNTQKKLITASIWINDNKDLFQKFLKEKEDIEKDFNSKLYWNNDATKSSTFGITDNIDISQENNWKNAFDWLCEMSIKLKFIVNKYDK
ncbi:MAG: DUF4268 domain-containing protein [Bacteroidales bacterium]|jgi:hypothetical protein|nr:DUF4268 domain-containing protein [Bacteroidales bacterium]